jgi:hypothetical protein
MIRQPRSKIERPRSAAGNATDRSLGAVGTLAHPIHPRPSLRLGWLLSFSVSERMWLLNELTTVAFKSAGETINCGGSWNLFRLTAREPGGEGRR